MIPTTQPIGFSAALEVLEAIPGSRKILVTPGMVELGEFQEQENYKIGAPLQSATLCVVGNNRSTD